MVSESSFIVFAVLFWLRVGEVFISLSHFGVIFSVFFSPKVLEVSGEGQTQTVSLLKISEFISFHQGIDDDISLFHFELSCFAGIV